jgi:hypothetical protein
MNDFDKFDWTPHIWFKNFSHIDGNREKYIATLGEAVEIKSVSAWLENRREIVKMMEWTKNRLECLGAKVELCDIGEQVCMCFSSVYS